MAKLVPIDDGGDPALEPYTAVRERDLGRRDGLFLAEGEVVVRVLAREGRFSVRSLLLEVRRVEALRDVIDGLPTDVPVYVVPQTLMDQVVGFPIHRGVLALGERGEPLSPTHLLAGQAPLVVGLVGLTNHDNVGGIFRNAAAFGASAVLYDAQSCDPLYRKAIRVSAGAALIVPFAKVASGEAMLDALEAADIEPFAFTPGGDEDLDVLAEARRTRGRALLFGTEGPGLPEAILKRARRVRIDMRAGFDSLNVAVSSGIGLFAATWRSRPDHPR